MCLNLLDEDATQDAKVNCARFNYANQNDTLHDKLDGDPAKIKMNEPKFREDKKH